MGTNSSKTFLWHVAVEESEMILHKNHVRLLVISSVDASPGSLATLYGCGFSPSHSCIQQKILRFPKIEKRQWALISIAPQLRQAADGSYEIKHCQHQPPTEQLRIGNLRNSKFFPLSVSVYITRDELRENYSAAANSETKRIAKCSHILGMLFLRFMMIVRNKWICIN